MKCIICNGENIRKTSINEEMKIEKNIVYLPINIPVCTTCGEKYYYRRTIQYLEEEEKRLKAGKVLLNEVGKVLESNNQFLYGSEVLKMHPNLISYDQTGRFFVVL